MYAKDYKSPYLTSLYVQLLKILQIKTLNNKKYLMLLFIKFTFNMSDILKILNIVDFKKLAETFLCLKQFLFSIFYQV